VSDIKVVIFDFFGVFCPDITLEWFKTTVPDHQAKLATFQSICTRSDYGQLSRKDFFKEVSELAGISIPSMESGVEAQTVIDMKLVKFVKHLKNAGYRMVCLSNGTHEWTLRVITDNGLGSLFDEIVLSGDLGIVKPNPQIYLTMLRKLDITPNEAIFIDDKKINIDAANELGIVSILFESTASLIDQLQKLFDIAN
jgi:epoxide hydrolase-like predicted phosphatase